MSLYRLVVLGDGGVGKTALTIQEFELTFSLDFRRYPFSPAETYDPTIEDSYRKQVVIDDQPCILEVLDTAGQEEYTALRDQWIRDGEGFILVYSITSRSTFERVERFKQQIHRVKDTDTVPLMLIGNKCDKVAEREVSKEEGQQMARRLHCDFLESSAKTCLNVDKAFFQVVRKIRETKTGSIRGREKQKKKPCTIL
ncbi:Ras GTPase ras2 [Geranomyces variabilis]|uniref:Ras GTPase ras2 n=1 Tax=Geranomyces variabilis TaxID=109894 RepID=A0AAD5TDG0_9FUNG|nr:Ras GTPase ras2 [Geranomyces variabilis]